MGLSRENMEAFEDKINAIEKHLINYKHEVEIRGDVDDPKVDDIPAKDQTSTLFEGPSETEMMSKMLDPSSKERQAQSSFQIIKLVLQRTAAMITGCTTPSTIIVGVAGLYREDRIIIIRAAPVVSALATFSWAFSVGFGKGNPQFGAGPPLTVGGGFIALCGNRATSRHQFPAGHGGCDRRHERDGLGSHG